MNESLFDAVLKSKRHVDASVGGFAAMAAAAVGMNKLSPSLIDTLATAARLPRYAFPDAAMKLANLATMPAGFAAMSGLIPKNHAIREAIRKSPIEHMISAGAFNPGVAAMQQVLRYYPAAAAKMDTLWRTMDTGLTAAPPGALWRGNMGAVFGFALDQLRSIQTPVAQEMEQEISSTATTIENPSNIDLLALKEQFASWLSRAHAELLKIPQRGDVAWVMLFMAFFAFYKDFTGENLTIQQVQSIVDDQSAKDSAARSYESLKSAKRFLRYTRIATPVRLDWAKGSMIIDSLPANHAVTVLQVVKTRIKVSYVDADSLPVLGWILKKHLK